TRRRLRVFFSSTCSSRVRSAKTCSFDCCCRGVGRRRAVLAPLGRLTACPTLGRAAVARADSPRVQSDKEEERSRRAKAPARGVNGQRREGRGVNYRTLGQTGLKVSEIAIGAFP